MNNLSVRLVFDRKHVATKKHQASVQLEVTYARKRKFIGTGIKLYSDQWGKDLKVKNHPQSVLYNRQLSDLVSDIYDFAHKLSLQKKEFSFEKLDEHLGNSGKDTSCSFLHFMRKRILERSIAETTRKKQWGILKALEEFGKIKSFSDICYQTIMAWDEFAKKRCHRQSSVYNYHKVLKTYIREAHASQLITVDPYQIIKLERGASENRKFLTKEELKRIEDKEFEDKCLERVRDMFLFCCYTGLAYADLSKFDFNEAIYSDGMYRIRDYRQKTGTEYNISLVKKAMTILEKYNYQLPIISNQKYNAFLKVIGAFCEIKKRLTSHVARHSFATMALAHDVPIENVARMLGHQDIKTTQIYAKVLRSTIERHATALQQSII